MPLYKYSAINDSGENIEGTFTASDHLQIIEMIYDKKFYPVSIKKISTKRDIKALGSGGKIKTKDLAIFCRQFSTMLNAGVTIVKTLDILQHQTENKKFKVVISQIYEDVQKGTTLSEALAKRSYNFPQLLVNMVRSGELSGNLDIIMNQMANLYEKENKLKNKIKGAMIYPIVLIIVTVLVVMFLLTFIMPTFVGMFESSEVELPTVTIVLMNISRFIRNFWYLILLVGAVVAYIAGKYIATDNGRLKWDKFKLRVPILKSTLVKIITARFSRTMSTLLTSGIPLLEAMEVTSKVVGNRVVCDGIMNGREDMKKGMGLSAPIHRIGIFPPMVDAMIYIGEESGTLDDILEKTADFYDEEAEVALQKMVTLVEPLLIVIMGFIVGFIVIAMALPMFNMVQTI